MTLSRLSENLATDATLTLVYVVAGKLGRTGRPQRELPRTKVVKTLNTCNCRVMVDPARAGRDHDVFRNDAGAKETVKAPASRFRLGNDYRPGPTSPRPERPSN